MTGDIAEMRGHIASLGWRIIDSEMFKEWLASRGMRYK